MKTKLGSPVKLTWCGLSHYCNKPYNDFPYYTTPDSC